MKEEKGVLWHLAHDAHAQDPPRARGDMPAWLEAQINGEPVDLFGPEFHDHMPVFTTVGNQREVIRCLEALKSRCAQLDASVNNLEKERKRLAGIARRERRNTSLLTLGLVAALVGVLVAVFR